MSITSDYEAEYRDHYLPAIQQRILEDMNERATRMGLMPEGWEFVFTSEDLAIER